MPSNLRTPDAFDGSRSSTWRRNASNESDTSEPAENPPFCIARNRRIEHAVAHTGRGADVRRRPSCGCSRPSARTQGRACRASRCSSRSRRPSCRGRATRPGRAAPSTTPRWSRPRPQARVASASAPIAGRLRAARAARLRRAAGSPVPGVGGGVVVMGFPSSGSRRSAPKRWSTRCPTPAGVRALLSGRLRSAGSTPQDAVGRRLNDVQQVRPHSYLRLVHERAGHGRDAEAVLDDDLLQHRTVGEQPSDGVAGIAEGTSGCLDTRC